ncbi:hypothetical protein A2U01_0039597, partial [Trifolium medium]|nr:hypothetical protein [Trifolium medium]
GILAELSLSEQRNQDCSLGERKQQNFLFVVAQRGMARLASRG